MSETCDYIIDVCQEHSDDAQDEGCPYCEIAHMQRVIDRTAIQRLDLEVENNRLTAEVTRLAGKCSGLTDAAINNGKTLMVYERALQRIAEYRAIECNEPLDDVLDIADKALLSTPSGNPKPKCTCIRYGMVEATCPVHGLGEYCVDGSPEPKTCSCKHSDPWRCAVAKQSSDVACHCVCHGL